MDTTRPVIVALDFDTVNDVVRLARLAQGAGCHGVVASPQDAAMLRAELGPGMLIVTPGVKLRAEMADEAATEHARPAHVATAIRAGATHIVIGRSLARAPDPAAVLAQIKDELGGQGTRAAGSRSGSVAKPATPSAKPTRAV